MLPERPIAPYLKLSVTLCSDADQWTTWCLMLPSELFPASGMRLSIVADEYLIPMLAQVLDARANTANLASTSTRTGE